MLGENAVADFKIEYAETISDEIGEKVHQGHVLYEASHGISCNYRLFSLVAKNAKGEVVGLLTAYTAYAEIYLDDIFIDQDYRKLGLGRQLLKNLEDRFRAKGYNNINLVTSQFQAPDFYKKCGFEVEFIRKNKCNPSLSKTFFVKYFDDVIQTQGML